MIGSDFDKTLTNYDTFFPFLRFYSTKSILKRLGLVLVIGVALALKLRLVSNDKYKSIAAKLMFRGDLYADFKKSAHKFSATIQLNTLGQQISSKVGVIILSASPKEYIEPLFPSAIVYGTELDIDDKGFIKGISTNLYGQKKLLKFRENHDRKMTLFYSDSSSDSCMREVSDEFILVNVKKII